MGRCGHGSPVTLPPPPADADVLHTSPDLFIRSLHYSSSILRLLQLATHEPSPIRTIVAAPSPNLAPHCSPASGDVLFCIVLTPIVELGGSWDAVVMAPLSLSRLPLLMHLFSTPPPTFSFDPVLFSSCQGPKRLPDVSCQLGCCTATLIPTTSTSLPTASQQPHDMIVAANSFTKHVRKQSCLGDAFLDTLDR